MAFCRDCGSEINEKAVVCPGCGCQQREFAVSSRHDKSPGLVAVIELVLGIICLPGIGHMYIGRFGRGVAILFLYLFLIAFEIFAYFIIGIGTLGLGLIVLMPLSLVINGSFLISSTYWAYKTALDGDEPQLLDDKPSKPLNDRVGSSLGREISSEKSFRSELGIIGFLFAIIGIGGFILLLEHNKILSVASLLGGMTLYAVLSMLSRWV